MVELRIGDKLMHPVYGPGTLISIEKQRTNGEVVEYYVIELARDRGRLATPVEKAEELGLHRPISKTQRDKVWKALSGRPRSLPQEYLKRRKKIFSAFREGNVVDAGRAVRDLAWREIQGHATMGDRRLLKRGKELLARELAAADGMGKDETLELIESTFEETLPA